MVRRELLFNYCSQSLTASCIVKEDLRLFQCREAFPSCFDIEGTHDELLSQSLKMFFSNGSDSTYYTNINRD